MTSDGTYGGWEHSIVAALADNMNFSLDIRPPPNGEMWGEYKNGSFTGGLLILTTQSLVRDVGVKDSLVSCSTRGLTSAGQTCSWCLTG